MVEKLEYYFFGYAPVMLRKREPVATLCCSNLCSVSLPYGAVVWSAVCDCGISWSYSLTLSNNFKYN